MNVTTLLWASQRFPKIYKPLVVYQFYCMALFHSQTRRHMIKEYYTIREYSDVLLNMNFISPIEVEYVYSITGEQVLSSVLLKDKDNVFNGD